MVSEGGCFEMTREGAEIIIGAVEAIYEQCTEAGSCENCPLGYDSPICCEDLFECVPDY